MKLLQIVWNFPDTITRPFDMYYFYWPVREAALRGWQAEVLTFQVDQRQSRDAVIDGIRVTRCPVGKHKKRAFSWSYIRALLTTNADIIHTHGYAEGHSELAILLARLRGRKVIFTPHFHIYPYRRPLRELYDRTVGRYLFNLSDRVIVFTEYTRSYLIALGVRPEKLRVVPHVARSEVFEGDIDEEEPGKLLREAGCTGSPLILGVGQLIKRKGWEYMVRCMPAIVARFPQAVLLILGYPSPDEPAFPDALMQLSKELGVQDHVLIRLNNSTEFMRDAYRSATIMTLPSLVESFGIVLLEALAARLPVVAHNGTGLPCIIDDGVTGSVVDVRDTEQYTAALLALLSDDAGRARMGEAGRQQALTRFSLETVAEQLFAVYAIAASSSFSISSSFSVSSSRSSKPSIPAASLEERISSKS
ncbi:MAG TPA: glycosyltransferase family 4 protein [Ktedonobacteraceae bacterium]|nr:glycosyltransferase family 4 protein [Ktedonobacteraceae bacterium]